MSLEIDYRVPTKIPSATRRRQLQALTPGELIEMVIKLEGAYRGATLENRALYTALAMAGVTAADLRVG